MHRGGPGYHKIESGKYVVSDEDCDGTLISETNGSTAFSLAGALHSVSYSNTRVQTTKSNVLNARRLARGQTFIQGKEDGVQVS